MPTGGLVGLKRRGTIIKYLGGGKVVVKLDDGTSVSSDENTHTVSLPIAFCSPDGAFMGGYPEPKTPVTIEQGQGEWFISGFEKPDNIFPNKNTSGKGGISSNIMGELLPGRLLFQTNDAANRLYLDPEEGIVAGTPTSSQHLDPKRNIISHNFGNEMAFTAAHRAVRGTTKRDINFNSLRNVEGSILYSHNYDDNLWRVGMDPASIVSGATLSGVVRNLSLVENREITYEFDDITGLDFEADETEIDKYSGEFHQDLKTIQKALRPESRDNTFALNLHWPNHLLEITKGTGVDTFGNIIDLNRSILPLGREISFVDNNDRSDAFKKIRASHRRALAYHFEINARKPNPSEPDGLFAVPLASDAEARKKNYARARSTFFVDVDKEGQFKINVPSSSEIGNVPLPTRYILSSTLAYENKDIADPNTFILEDEGVDIFLEAYGHSGTDGALRGITLKGEEGEAGPVEWFLGEPVKLNTSFHNILLAGYQFTKARVETDPGGLLVRYMPDSRLNKQDATRPIQQDDIVTNEILVNGPEANAGGRSGTISMDGFLSMNIGANTVDRQSLWLDTAGSIVSTIGRDKRGISYCASLDGDMLVQIGGHGLGDVDDRFASENDAARSGALDIRVIKSDGQLTVIRIDHQGLAMATYGRCEIMSQQDMVFKSNTNIMFEAPNIGFYYESAEGRWIKRTMAKELA